MKLEQSTPVNKVKDAVRNSLKLSTQRIPKTPRSKCYDNNKDIDPNANNVNNDNSS